MEKWLEEVSLSLNSISPAKSRTDATQPETHELQQVCCRHDTLLSSSRYQDAFASLAPA